MQPDISVVIPLYNEEESLPELVAWIDRVCDENRYAYEIVMVDDGSTDNSWEVVKKLAAQYTTIKAIKFQRNYGKSPALHEGFKAVSGRVVITMDADLQDPPEVIPDLVRAWTGGAEVVRAVRRSRRETGLRRAGLDVFHGVFGKLTDYPIEPNTGTFGLLGREALAAYNALPERRRFFPGLRAWIGFHAADVTYDRQERAAGKPQQTFRRLVRYALDVPDQVGELSVLAATIGSCSLPITIFIGLYGLVIALVISLIAAYPKARATSRCAERDRYVMTLAT